MCIVILSYQGLAMVKPNFAVGCNNSESDLKVAIKIFKSWKGRSVD